MNILVLSHSLDDVMRRLFGDLSEKIGCRVFIAGPGEAGRTHYGACTGVDTPAVKSKISPAAIAAVRRLVKRLAIDIVFAPSTSALSNALLATTGLKAKCVGYRGTQHRIHRSDIFNYLALLNPRVAHICCETADIREHLLDFVPARKLSWKSKPFHLDWVADDLAAPVDPRPDTAPDTLRLIFVGVAKGRPYKGLGVLLEAMKLLENDNVALTVVGEAGEADMAGAPASVIFTGNRSDAVSIMATHHVFVLPSLRDASPRVLREAQACGLPCIVSDIPGARNLIQPGISGFLVAPGDPGAIADAVRKLAGDSALRAAMSDGAKQNIARNFRPDDFTDYYAGVFKSL